MANLIQKAETLPHKSLTHESVKASDKDDQVIIVSEIVRLVGRVSGGTGLADALTSLYTGANCVTKATVKHFGMMAQALPNKRFITVNQEKMLVSIVT